MSPYHSLWVRTYGRYPYLSTGINSYTAPCIANCNQMSNSLLVQRLVNNIRVLVVAGQHEGIHCARLLLGLVLDHSTAYVIVPIVDHHRKVKHLRLVRCHSVNNWWLGHFPLLKPPLEPSFYGVRGIWLIAHGCLEVDILSRVRILWCRPALVVGKVTMGDVQFSRFLQRVVPLTWLPFCLLLLCFFF